MNFSLINSDSFIKPKQGAYHLYFRVISPYSVGITLEINTAQRVRFMVSYNQNIEFLLDDCGCTLAGHTCISEIA